MLYWVDLQLVHWFHCCDNIHVCMLIALYTAHAYSAECEMSANDCTHCMPGAVVFVYVLSYYVGTITFALK